MKSKELPRDAINEQLDRILSSERFKRSEAMSKFLRYIIEKFHVDEHSQIKAYNIAVDVFDRPESYDPQTKSFVRVYGGRLRRELKQYYERQGINDPILIEIPKGGYSPLIQMNYGKTDRGIQSPLSFRHNENNIVSAISLAIVPFNSLTDDDNAVYFTAGLIEELLIALTRFPNLKIIGPLYTYSGKQVSLKKIGHEYGALFVLQGNVRKRGDALRITAKLGETQQGINVWARNYDFDLNNESLHDIEDKMIDSVAATIADEYGVILRTLHSETHQRYVQFSEVTDAVIKYHRCWITNNPDDASAAIQALQKSLNKEPENALVMAMLADMLWWDHVHNNSRIVPDNLALAEKYVQNALFLDSNLQMAHFSYGEVLAAKGLINEAIKELKIAIDLNPNAVSILTASSVFLAMAGEWELAMKWISRAMHLNPQGPSFNHFVPFMYHYKRKDYESAWREAQAFHLPDLFWHPVIRIAVLGQLSRKEEAKPFLKRLKSVMPDFHLNGRELMKRHLLLDSNVDMLWDGLKKAGMT